MEELITEQEQVEEGTDNQEQSLAQTVDNQQTDEATQQGILDWTQDKRAKTMWKNDPNQLYGSYKNMEKLYNPLKGQVEKYKSVFSEYGIEDEKLPDIFKEYSTLKDPQSPQNQWLNYLGGHLNAEHKDEVMNFFNELDRKADQKKYGENLPTDVIEKLKKVEMLEQQMQAREQQEQEEVRYKETISIMEKGLSEVEKLAKNYDVVFDEETKSGLLDYCATNKIDPKYIPQTFAMLALDAVKKSASTQASTAIIDNLNTNRKAGISTKSTVGTSPKGALSFREEIAQKLGF